MKSRSVAIIILIMFLSGCSLVGKSAEVVIYVVGDSGEPISGADVSVYKDGVGGNANNGTAIKGISDVNGKFTASMTNYNGYVSYHVHNKGYYEYNDKFQFTREPWIKIVEVRLNKIINPVPMYARNTQYSKKQVEIPKVEQKIGFDLIEFDFVKPYGNGTNEDMIFYLERNYSKWNKQECRLEITFKNKNDGIVLYKKNINDGSALKLPRYAPEHGYLRSLELIIKADGYYFTNAKDDDNYFIKIRSGTENPIYGKIEGGIDFFPQHSENNTAIISMKYYINPDGTRNMEFDPSKNLFKNLDFLEDVKNP